MILKFLRKLLAGSGSQIISHSLTSEAEEEIRRSWVEIEQMLKSQSPSSLKQAVIEADKIFDRVLKQLVKGEAMGERLKNAGELFRDRDTYSGVWEAHKVRNMIVHEESVSVPYFACKEAVGKFREGLEVLGVTLPKKL